jgi:cytochrome c-type biogenesis protein CcmH/NrfF
VAAVGGQLVSSLPLAHVSHWLVQLLYVVPVVIVVGALAITSIRDRRAERAEGSMPDPADEPAVR